MSNIVDFPDDSRIEIEASEWIVKFDDKQSLTDSEITELRAWVTQSPRHKQVLVEMAEHWQQMDLLSELSIPQLMSDAPSERQRTPFFVFSQRLKARFFQPIQASAIIASLLVLVSATWLVTTQISELGPEQAPIAAVSQITYETQLGEQAHFTLPDGSILHLNTKSKASVHYSAHRRLIKLHQGEGYFDVAHDTTRPFDVVVGQQIVRAVGTAFTVRLAKETLQVVVAEGTVDVRTSNEELASALTDTALQNTVLQDAGLQNQKRQDKPTQEKQHRAPHNEQLSRVLSRLSAGQSIEVPMQFTIADTDSTSPLPNKVTHHREGELERKLAWLDGQLSFAGEPLVEVLAEVSRYTETQIDVLDEDLKQMRIGGQFKAGEIDALIDVLQHGFQLQVTKKTAHHVEISKKNEKKSKSH